MAETKPAATAGDTQVNALRSEVRRLSNTLEDVLDHVFGVNVRPPTRERTSDEYPAQVKLSNDDD